MKYGYEVNIKSNLIYSSYSGGEYDVWEEEYENHYQSVTKTDRYPDIVSDIDFHKGEKVYLVWLEYSTGDSLGTSFNSQTVAIGLFRNKEDAEELKRELIKKVPDEEKTWGELYGFYHQSSDGQEFVYKIVPWSGIFESLENVYIEETVIE